MKTNKTSILMILDRSGSMASMHSDLIGGVNNFISEQKNLPGECELSIVQFDDLPEDVCWQININATPIFNKTHFVPRNSTALIDSMGYGIEKLGKSLSDTPEEDRPGKVIVLIYSDGQENASKKFNKDQIATLIKQQKEVYSWEFIFLGSNQDAIMTAAQYNIGANSSLTYNASAAGNFVAFSGASYYASGVRVCSTGHFTDTVRSAAMQ